MWPTFSLAAFWFLYMSAMGIFFPFYALYLRENAGLSGTEIGVVYAMIPLVSLVAPTFWGRLADRSSSRGRVLGASVLGTAMAYVALGVAEGFGWLSAATALLAIFGTAVLPLGVSVSLSVLGPEGQYTFGRVRVWGTVGYLLLVVTFPWLLHAVEGGRPLNSRPGGPSEPGLELMFFVAASFCLGAAAVAWRIPSDIDELPFAASREWRRLFGHGPFLRMLAFGFTAYLFLQGPMNFFPAYVRSRGGGLDALSHMWVVMLIPEIPLVVLSGTGLRRFGPRGLLAVGVAAGGIRWVLCGLTETLWVVYAVQALHGVTVAGLLIGGPLYIDAAVPPRIRATAQGLLAMAGVGVGGIASSVGTGWLLDRFGVDAAYLAGGIGALLLSVLTARALPTPARPE